MNAVKFIFFVWLSESRTSPELLSETWREYTKTHTLGELGEPGQRGASTLVSAMS